METTVIYRKSENGTALTRKKVNVKMISKATIAKALGIKKEQIETYVSPKAKEDFEIGLKNSFHQQTAKAHENRDLHRCFANKGTYNPDYVRN